MIQFNRLILTVFITIIFLTTAISTNVQSCKVIVAVDDATAGDYNLMLKVRDPSRPGLQTLTIIPKGYTYSYHHPWTGKTMDFTVDHKYIGIATEDDVPPNIFKPGMALSETGLGYSDADSGSLWLNPTRNAWDDFDWMRYGCEKANNEEEAVTLMTEDVVDKLHATAVSENLFVLGPKKGFLIEADAYHYEVQKVDDVLVMSNYPKALWKTQRLQRRPLARSFDTVKEIWVREGRAIRLGAFYGVKIVDIGENSIGARQAPLPIFGERVTIFLGERQTVGQYSIRLLEIDGNRAKISMMYKYKEWEGILLNYIQQKHGSIKLKDMMRWTRLHSEDLEGLRPMCEDRVPYESALIYKIPTENYNLLSSIWFASNHACSSIYVPIHICDTDIHESYKNGLAAQVSLDLLESYGHGTLTQTFEEVENIFLQEIEVFESIARDMIHNNTDVSEFLTTVDMDIQELAWQILNLWLELKDHPNRDQIIDNIEDIWESNYILSLENIANSIISLGNISGGKTAIDNLVEIALTICESRIVAAQALGKNSSTVEEEFRTGKEFTNKGEYTSGFEHIENSFNSCTRLIYEYPPLQMNVNTNEENKNEEDLSFIGYILAAIAILLTVSVAFLLNKRFNR